MSIVHHVAVAVIGAAIPCASCIAAGPTQIVEFGPQTFFNDAWRDPASGLTWLAGMNLTGIDTPTMWSVDGAGSVVEYPLTGLLPGATGVVAAIAPNGAIVGGGTTSGKSPSSHEGTVWTFGAWTEPQGIGWLPGGISDSEVRAVTNSGAVAGFSSGLFPFIKEPDGRMVQMPPLPGGSGNGTVDAITPDGTVAVGNTQNAAGFGVAVKWIPGEPFAIPLEDPASVFSGALAVSPDGTRIGGTVADETGLWAALWDDEGLHELHEAGGERFQGVVFAVMNDGFFAGDGAFGGFDLRAFVGHVDWPHVITLEEWLQQHGVADPPALENVRGLHHDGTNYHFVLQGVSTPGWGPGYYVRTPHVGVFGDLSEDGTVDAADLAQLLAAWGECDGCAEDLTGDGAVDAADLAALLGAWSD